MRPRDQTGLPSRRRSAYSSRRARRTEHRSSMVRRVNGKDDPPVSKKEIVRTIAEEMKADQAVVKEVVQRMLDRMLEVTATRGRLELRNFGVFQIKKRASRIARNPRTNQEVRVPAKLILSFRAGKNVRRRIQQANLPNA